MNDTLQSKSFDKNTVFNILSYTLLFKIPDVIFNLTKNTDSFSYDTLLYIIHTVADYNKVDFNETLDSVIKHLDDNEVKNETTLNKMTTFNDDSTLLSTNENENYEQVNHPSHYNNYGKEVIDMMESIWGTEKLIAFCEMNAFKYRMRMGTKPDNPIQQDIEKEKWYLNKANQLKNKLKQTNNS